MNKFKGNKVVLIGNGAVGSSGIRLSEVKRIAL